MRHASAFGAVVEIRPFGRLGTNLLDTRTAFGG